jgi:hypothetical protein
MRFFLLAVVVLLFCSTTGCANAPALQTALNGSWLVTISTRDIGSMQVMMTFETDQPEKKDSLSFEAYSKKDMDKLILGRWKAGLARIAGGNFKNGSLIRITKATLFRRDSIHAILVTPFGNYYLDATLNKDTLNGVLSDGNRDIAGQVQGSHRQPKLPLLPYPAIIDSALSIAAQKLYDPTLTRSDDWARFKKEIRRISRETEDDAALVMAFFYYARLLPFSHFSFVRSGATTSENLSEVPKPVLTAPTSDCALLTIPSFSAHADMLETIFTSIAASNYKYLVVDLRGNPGGSIEAGMTFMRHLIPDTLYGGIFLTQQYFRKNTTPPPPATYRRYPSFSAANYDLLIRGISELPAICLVAFPQEPVFRGQIFILTDQNTASACEPIVYAFKQHHLATIVGQTTAGAMLTSESFPVANGYHITIPTATYYTSDGFKIDRNGVRPDIVLNGEDALAYVMKQLATIRKK